MQFNVSFALVPETFLLLFRLWACDCQCGMNEIRHGHIVHPFEMKRKRWNEAFSFFFFLRQLTSLLFNALSIGPLAHSFVHSFNFFSFVRCVCYFICCSCFACKTTHFECRLCAITQKVQFIHSSLSKYERVQSTMLENVICNNVKKTSSSN